MSDIAITAAAAPNTRHTAPSSGPSLWSHGSFSFKDLLDIINPLQHIPIVDSIYRYLTGDEPSGGARIVGDAIYGGPIGLGVGVVSTMLTNSKGQGLGEQLLADIFGPSGSSATVGKPKEMADASKAKLLQLAADRAEAAPAQPVDPTRLAATLFHSPAPISPAPAASTSSVSDASTASSAALPSIGKAAATSDAASSATAAAASAKAAAQKYLALNARFRRLGDAQGRDGGTLHNQPVPLELSGGMLPMGRPAAPALAPAPASAPARPATAPSTGPASSKAAPAATSAGSAAEAMPTNPIARKMIEALDKYDQMKKKQEQQDNADTVTPPKVSFSL